MEAVSGKFQLGWGTYMSSFFDIVYVKLDIIGSVGEGSRSANVRLNNRQIQDYIAAIK